MPRLVAAKGKRDSSRWCVAALHSSEPMISPCTTVAVCMWFGSISRKFLMQVVDIADRRIVRGTDRLGTAQGAVAPQLRPAYKDWARAQGISPCPANGTSRLIAPDAESLFHSARWLLPKKSLR